MRRQLKDLQAKQLQEVLAASDLGAFGQQEGQITILSDTGSEATRAVPPISSNSNQQELLVGFGVSTVFCSPRALAIARTRGTTLLANQLVFVVASEDRKDEHKHQQCAWGKATTVNSYAGGRFELEIFTNAQLYKSFPTIRCFHCLCLQRCFGGLVDFDMICARYRRGQGPSGGR